MSLLYLPEHAEGTLQALRIAQKEAAHLQYSRRTLFAKPIDVEWVNSLSTREDLAEKIEAFVSRFGRLQDHIGEKLLPRFAALLGESPKSIIDVLAHAERMRWVESGEAFIGARKLRNLLVHEYMSDTQLFLNALLLARDAADMLIRTVSAMENEAAARGLPSSL